MSDGNYNRALLPKNELSTGLRAGRAQMRAKAEAAFDEVAKEFLSEMDEVKRCEMKTRFYELIRK